MQDIEMDKMILNLHYNKFLQEYQVKLGAMYALPLALFGFVIANIFNFTTIGIGLFIFGLAYWQLGILRRNTEVKLEEIENRIAKIELLINKKTSKRK